MANEPDLRLASDPTLVFTDPLTEVTRKERRSLLGISVATVVLTETGLYPTRIQVLGMDLDTALHASMRAALLWTLTAVLTYFLVIFVVHLIIDVSNWSAAGRRADYRNVKEGIADFYSRWSEDVANPDKVKEHLDLISAKYVSFRDNYVRIALRARYARAVVDYFLPVLISIVAFVDLVLALLHKQPLLRLLTSS